MTPTIGLKSTTVKRGHAGLHLDFMIYAGRGQAACRRVQHRQGDLGTQVLISHDNSHYHVSSGAPILAVPSLQCKLELATKVRRAGPDVASRPDGVFLAVWAG
jgi:hypothetical protein